MVDLLERLRAALADSYRVEHELGRGGMASVFLAQDLKHRRRVAIKVFDPELAVVLGPDRFLREIEIAGRLQHPHILTLLVSGVADGLLYYVMPYVEGESLRERLNRERQLPLEDALRLSAEVAGALDDAHRHGVVHRDIKPENILLSGGHAVVADFGIARAIHAAGGATATPRGAVLGTPLYSSPEQVVGSSEVDGRSDIYSLGCVLYEMLAGQPPFTGPNAETLVHQHLSVEPRPVTDLRPAVPEAVARAMAKALAKTPADRFSTASRFAEALTGVGAPAARRVRFTARRGAAIGGAVLLVAAAAYALLPWRSARPWSPRNLAVLPFTNVTGDPGMDYLCEGIAAGILSALVQVKRLNVVSQTTAWTFRGTGKDAAAIAKELGVNALLEGAILKRGASIRIDVQLVNARSGYVMWSGRFDRAMDDLLGLENEIVQQVARTESGQLSVRPPSGLARPPTRSPEAYDYYLKASRVLDDTDDPHGPDKAAELNAKAIALDEDFALAYAGLSKALWRTYSRTKEPETIRRAEEASDRAIRLNPALLEARLARAQMFRGTSRYAESIAELTGILEINPNWDEAHLQLAASYREAGDLVRAETSCRRALSLRPGYWKNWSALGALLIRKGDYDGARVAFEEIVRLTPEMNRGYELLAALATMEGNYAEAVAAYQRLPAPVVDGHLASNIATAHFFLGQLDRAEEFYLLAVRLEPRNQLWHQNLGDLYRRQGKVGPARNEYRQAVRLADEQLALNPDARVLRMQRVVCLAKLGDCDNAARSLEALLPKLPAIDAQHAHSIARVRALCGHREEAIAALRKAIELGISPRLIREEDEFRSLAGDSEFVRLTAGLPGKR